MSVAIPPLPHLKTLVLNADMQPLSWGPLSVWSWQDALVAVLQKRVHEICTYDFEIRSASQSFRIPSVIALKTFQRRHRVSFTRYHVFLRDRMRCQYCGNTFPAKDLTFDHVIPRSRGGRTSWDNIVTCCHADNLRKGAKTPKEAGMRLLRLPSEPSPHHLDLAARSLSGIKDGLHETWLDFLYWDISLEE